MKKLGTEMILFAIVSPAVLVWIISFIGSSYEVKAQVADEKADIQEIKVDVKAIKNYLLEHPIEKTNH